MRKSLREWRPRAAFFPSVDDRKSFGRLEVSMSHRKQSGQVLAGFAVTLVVLLGFAGLAIDMGTLRYEKRLQQTAADAAATAGAQNLQFAVINGNAAGTGVTTGAQVASTQNGFTDGGG